MKRFNNKLISNQKGLVSIIVSMILMLVVALIVLGFARLTRREQRQALDRQLSTQAYYAAETAVNDVQDALSNGINIPENTDDCNDTIAVLPPSKNQLDATTSYSCLFVDPSPPSLEYKSVDINSSKVIPLQDKNNAAIDTVLISWQDKDGGTSLAGCGSPAPVTFPPSNNWTCDTGIMRVDIVAVPGSFDRDWLVNNTMTVFLYPSSDAGADTNELFVDHAGFGKQGTIIGARCNSSPGPKQCNFEIKGLTGNNYVMRLKSVYRSSSVTIKATNPLVGGTLELVGAQTLVDSTGKANDVLRRIQVRIAAPDFSSNFPEAAIHSVGNICKRFAWAPPSTYTPDIGVYPDCDVTN